MNTRRDFIYKSSVLAGSLFLPSTAFSKTQKYVAIQLWSLRDEMEKDAKSTLKKIAKMGFNEVEAYGWDFYGMNPKPFKTFITDLGLRMRSAHGAIMKKNPLEVTPPNLQESIDRAKEAGLKYYIIPYMEQANYNTLDNCKRTAEYLNMYGEMCKKSDLQLLYHNHDFEFQTIENTTVYEILLNNTDSNNLKFELDLYWINKAGKNPIDLFKKYQKRFPLWHVKDQHKSLNESTEIGNGNINFAKIFKHSDLAGLELHVIEQENYQGKSQFESAKICLKNFKKINF